MVVDEASSETNFVWMEREARRLTDSRSHEALVTLNCTDLRSVKAMNCNVLTRTERDKSLIQLREMRLGLNDLTKQ